MKVVHFVESFSPLTETFIYDSLVELEHQGIQNIVVTLNRLNEVERPFPRTEIIKLPARYHPLRLWSRIASHFGWVNSGEQYWPIILDAFNKIIARIQPDILHAHFGQAGVLILPTSLHLPLVTTFYGYDASSFLRDRRWRENYAMLFERAKVVVLSEQMRTSLQAHSNGLTNSFSIIHLGKRLTDYPYRRRQPPLRNWLTVGRLTEKKGHLDTIEAFAELIDDFPYLQLDIIGDGEMRLEIQNRIAAKGLQNHIRLMSALPHQQVVQEFQKADAFILCSKTAANGDMEGTPTVLIEAQALGLPCVSTHHAGIPETIPEDNHCLLASEGNVQEITSCMRYLLECNEEQLHFIGGMGRRHVEQHFNIEFETRKLCRLYGELFC